MARRDLPVRAFKTAKAWETWLSRHDDAPGLWVRLAKRSAGRQSLTHREAVEGALCYGWIDGQGKPYDDESWLVKFTPRKPNSIWSKINRARASELVATGRMRPSGLASIQRAKQNGRWVGAYDSHRTAVPPRDLTAALKKSAKARAFFETLNSQNRYAILFRIQTAKRPETRRARIERFVRMLARHRTLYPR
ncbi:MAG TPA: YdeI/OmpD-associated family protein [Gemmatimonadales bacterium]